MKKIILLFAIITVILVSGCTNQPTGGLISSPNEIIKYHCADGSVVDDIDLCSSHQCPECPICKVTEEELNIEKEAKECYKKQISELIEIENEHVRCNSIVYDMHFDPITEATETIKCGTERMEEMNKWRKYYEHNPCEGEKRGY